MRGDVYWLTASGKKVPIKPGSPIFLNQHIITGLDSHLQILLLDETTFTLGPDADMVLTNSYTTQIQAMARSSWSLVKGMFRFVTGKVARSHPGEYEGEARSGRHRSLGEWRLRYLSRRTIPDTSSSTTDSWRSPKTGEDWCSGWMPVRW